MKKPSLEAPSADRNYVWRHFFETIRRLSLQYSLDNLLPSSIPLQIPIPVQTVSPREQLYFAYRILLSYKYHTSKALCSYFYDGK
jgi:hypothetical protein